MLTGYATKETENYSSKGSTIELKAYGDSSKINREVISFTGNFRDNLLYSFTDKTSETLDFVSNEFSEIDYYKNLVKKIPMSERDLASFQRKLQVNEKLYEFLLEKRANTSIAKSGIIPQTKIIEKARTVNQIGGKKNQTILFFGIVGFILSLIISTYCPSLRGRNLIHTVTDLKMSEKSFKATEFSALLRNVSITSFILSFALFMYEF